MNTTTVVSPKATPQIDRRFVTEADWIPSFWNFLVGLNRDDLIAELIQNDLDQAATRTIISFQKDQLVCEGNGNPVDAEGWKRLRIIQGAGDSVPAKRGKIGVKNHGLKTAFTIGDELQLMSAGQGIVQTLYAKGPNNPPYPGASDNPIVDSQAPHEGCRIVIRYRSATVEPIQGEAVVLPLVTEEQIDHMFQQACYSIPEQFAGIVSPGTVPRYEIILRHWRLDEARFTFSCTRTRKIVKRMELFRRHCKVKGTTSFLPTDLKEQAVRRLLPLKGRLRKRVADYYRRRRYFFAEVSWPIDRRGKPIVGTGRFRYPIGYPRDSQEAFTGHSSYFNGPFASNTERHAPAINEETNKILRTACEELLVDALACHAIPRWGPDGLNPLVPRSGTVDQSEAIRSLLAKLAKQGAIPALDWRTTAGLAFRGRKHQPVTTIRHIAARRRLKQERRYRFVMPVATWMEDSIHPVLSLLCPRSERQIDPRTHADIIRLLADDGMPGFTEDFITFDENDVFARVTDEGNKWFGAIVDTEQEFSEPFLTRAYLDLISESSDKEIWSGEQQKKLFEALMLPDVYGQPTPLTNLHSSTSLPVNIPGLNLPHILHPELVSHPLFRRRVWQLPKYNMAKFLKSDSLRVADEDVRKRFWQWLRQNVPLVPVRDRSNLAELVIWPDENGSLARVSDLCDPRSRRVGAVLAGFIRRPNEQVRRSKLVSVGRRARTSIQSVPSGEEIAGWLDAHLSRFEFGSIPGDGTIQALHRFENDLSILAKDKKILPMLKKIGVALPALSQDASLQPRTVLVMPSHKNNRLELPKRFLLHDLRNAASLNKISPTLSMPTASMLIDALDEDPGNISCLHTRLKQLLSITTPDADERQQLVTLPIIPFEGHLWKPDDLAFIGNRGDYWGSWKKRLPGTGLSQDDQQRFRESGVTSWEPNRTTSRAFFEWLGLERKDLGRHIPCVMRHILHTEGPMAWAESFTDIPFIPADSRDGLRLVSLRIVRKRLVYLPDAGNIEDKVIAKDPNVFLVINQVKEVTRPITERLRQLGVRSLREALKEPERVSGVGNVVQASEDMYGGLRVLKSKAFRRTFQKRLVYLGIEPDLVRHDWYDRLSRVKNLQIVDKIEALYRFRRNVYRVGIDAGFDPQSGVFLVKHDGGVDYRKLYESMAKCLVFKSAAKPIYHFSLEYAVALNINDPSFGRSAQSSDSNDPDEFIDSPGWGKHGDDQESDMDGETIEAKFGHSPFKPDESRNLPEPGPIPDKPTRLPRHRWGRADGGKLDRKGNDSGNTPVLEKEHVELLKLQHYASHCQICLCKWTPQELAPQRSYIFPEEVRRRIVEAHHVDLKSAEGARHAGNLILLCRLHHDNFGRRFTRVAITEALQANVEEKTIWFGPDTEVQGQKIEYVIPDTGEVIELFFTKQHADFWLTQGRA